MGAAWQRRELVRSNRGDASWPQSESVQTASWGATGVVLEQFVETWLVTVDPPTIRRAPSTCNTQPVPNRAVDDWLWVEAERRWIGLARDGSIWQRQAGRLSRVSPAARGFAPRLYRGSVWDPDRGRALYVGGYAIGTLARMCSDTWQWASKTGVTRIHTTGRAPRFMVSSACWFEHGVVAVGVTPGSNRRLLTARLIADRWELMAERACDYTGQFAFAHRDCLFMLDTDQETLFRWDGRWRKTAKLGGLAGDHRLALWVDPVRSELWGYGRLGRRSTGLAWVNLDDLAS